MFLRKIIQLIFSKFGYKIIRARDNLICEAGHEIYRYLKMDGSFDYALYKTIQISGNKQKLSNVWVLEENIEFLSEYIRSIIGSPGFGICHGTRRGKEQEWFRKYLKCDVIGTEISDTAEQFANTIQWDFHDIKSEWINSVDFIYSNSFDHSYDPENCLKTWMRCINDRGLCILEHTSGGHRHANQLDPFGAELAVMPYLILLWGKGLFYVREIIEAPVKPQSIKYSHFIIIQKK